MGLLFVFYFLIIYNFLGVCKVAQKIKMMQDKCRERQKTKMMKDAWNEGKRLKAEAAERIPEMLHIVKDFLRIPEPSSGSEAAPESLRSMDIDLPGSDGEFEGEPISISDEEGWASSPNSGAAGFETDLILLTAAAREASEQGAAASAKEVRKRLRRLIRIGGEFFQVWDLSNHGVCIAVKDACQDEYEHEGITARFMCGHYSKASGPVPYCPRCGLSTRTRPTSEGHLQTLLQHLGMAFRTAVAAEPTSEEVEVTAAASEEDDEDDEEINEAAVAAEEAPSSDAARYDEADEYEAQYHRDRVF